MMIVAEKTALRPFVKWAGGKQGICAKVAERFPKSYGTYFEPFVGGGSVLFQHQPERGVISDYNSWLIDTYLSVRDSPDDVIRFLEEFENSKKEFEFQRSRSVSSLPLNERAALFIYLNKTCFRGLFRVNKRGQFNVPYGNYQRRYYDREEILSASLFLRRVTIRSGDFENALFDVEEGDFVYLDPPYFKQGGYSDFDRYTENKFSSLEHIRLAAFCHELDARGIKFLQSNSNTPFIRELYSSFRVESIANRREINLNSQNRSIEELVISNY